MSHKNLAIATAAIAVFFAGLITLAASYSPLQAVNPIAALTAITVAIIGIAWFKKASK